MIDPLYLPHPPDAIHRVTLDTPDGAVTLYWEVWETRAVVRVSLID